MISNYDLRSGDDDAKRRWGGEVRPPSATDSDVADLKDALVAVGVLDPKKVAPRGQFGVDTRDAVILLQWYLDSVPGYLNAQGAFVERTINSCGPRDGVANATIRATLRTWVQWGFSCAGNLLKGSFSNYADIVAGSGFSELLGAGEFIVDRGFISAVDGAQALASANGLKVHANQFFRVEGATVSGAVVAPASFSAHKIGRAVDLNLSVGSGATQMSSAIKSAKAGTPFALFRDGMKSSHSCRYGGEFATSDPPHFDRQIIPAGNFEWKSLFYFNQRQFQKAKINADAIPLATSVT